MVGRWWAVGAVTWEGGREGCLWESCVAAVVSVVSVASVVVSVRACVVWSLAVMTRSRSGKGRRTWLAAAALVTLAVVCLSLLAGSVADGKVAHRAQGESEPDEFDGVGDWDDDEENDDDEFAPPPAPKQTKQPAPTKKRKVAAAVDDEDGEFDDEWAVDGDGASARRDDEDDPDFSDFDAVPAGQKKKHKAPQQAPKKKRSKKAAAKTAAEGPTSGGGGRPRVQRRKQTDFTYEQVAGVFFFLYFVTYFYGSATNARYAMLWIKKFRAVYEDEFAEVGKHGGGTDAQSSMDLLLKESQSQFLMYASGRANCRGVLTELKFKDRQDLVSVLYDFVTPTHDFVTLSCVMADTGMHPFIFAILPRKEEKTIRKERLDLKTYGPKERRVQGLPDSLSVFSDSIDVVALLANGALCQRLTKHLKSFHSMHFTDQRPDPAIMGMAEPTQKVLSFTFKLNQRHDPDMQSMGNLIQMAFQFIDLVGEKVRLSAKAKASAEKERATVQKRLMAKSSEEREEAFQARRDAKFKAEMERYKRMSPAEQAKFDEKKKKQEIKKAMRKQTKMVR